MAGIVIAVRCNYCSRQQSPRNLHRIGGEDGKLICPSCIERHNEALDAMRGRIPHACHECGITAEALEAITGEVRFKLVPKDGIYQILCIPCEGNYVPKRNDLYGVITDGRI